MPRFCQRTFKLVAAFALCTLILVPMGTAGELGSHAVALTTTAATGPTLPPIPWDGLMTGPTLPPIPWDGLKTGPTLPPIPWDGLKTGPTLPPIPWDGLKTGPTLPPIPWDGIA